MKRVFILASHCLFGRCIESLLRQQEGVQIVGHAKDLAGGIEQIRALRPDVVVIDSEDTEAARAAVLLQVIKEEIKAHVVGVSLSDNKAFVFHGEQRVINELGDFIETIQPPDRPPAAAPVVAVQDGRGRTLDHLRISVTDRCNLRCVYCMPPEGIAPKPRQAILRSEHIVRIVQAAAALGFHSVQLTGGEPLMRKGIVGLVRMLAEIPGIDEVALTTNGTLLAARARELAAAGLKRVNIELNSLQPGRFRQITRVGDLVSVWQGIAAAEDAGLAPLQINMVVIRGVNDDQVVEFARLTVDHPWRVRFVELKPTDCAPDWGPGMPVAAERLVTVPDIRQRLASLGSLALDDGPQVRGALPYYRLPDARGTLGFISSASHRSCDVCNRMHLTADGSLRSCFLAETGVNLKPALDDGASLRDLRSLIRQAAKAKPEHPALAASPVAG